jgi:hypothetical protein
MVTEKNKPRQVGRKPKADPCRHRYAIYMNDAENVRFLSMCEEAASHDKSRFIKSFLFSKGIESRENRQGSNGLLHAPDNFLCTISCYRE